MDRYDIPLVPGPTRVPAVVLEALGRDYGAADLEPEFFELYGATQDRLRRILRTEHDTAIMTGEGMVALWGALKSCLRPGDRVLSVATGPFGHGIGRGPAASRGRSGPLPFPPRRRRTRPWWRRPWPSTAPGWSPPSTARPPPGP